MVDEVKHRGHDAYGRFTPGGIELTGRVFGRLTVHGRFVGGKAPRWECRCECGTSKVIRGSCLLSGNTRSCGCLGKQSRLAHFEDITGRIFGRLTIIERRVANVGEKSRWRCLCKCGRVIECEAGNLKNGSTSSCGCLEAERKAERRGAFIGNRFGRLIVLGEAESRRSNRARFLCVCDCGTEKVVSGNSLRQGVVSCGCAVFNRDPTLRSDEQKMRGRQFRHARLARQREAGGTFTVEDVIARFKWQRGRCAAPGCRVRLSKTNYRIDHIEPLSHRQSKTKNRVALNAPRNLQLLCQPCNAAKSDKDPIQWARDSGLLL